MTQKLGQRDIYSDAAVLQTLVWSPARAWGDAVGQLLALPAIRGVWTMGNMGPAGNVVDLSGQGRTLINNGVCTFGYDGLAPYVNFISASSQYLDRADEAALDITGTEAYVYIPARGLTMGGWFYPNATGTVGLFGKWTTSNQSYLLDMAGSTLYFSVSGTGADIFSATGAGVTIETWYFVCGRFDPSTEVAIWVNDDKQVNTTSIPAAIFSGTAPLEVGRRNASSTYCYEGGASLLWLCGTMLSDGMISAMWQQQRALFGV